MIIDNKVVIVYDIEVFPNCFSCCCKNTETGQVTIFEISERKNQTMDIVRYFCSDKTLLFCGYNNHHYDDIILNYIFYYRKKISGITHYEACKSISHLSKIIIDDVEESVTRYKKWKYLHYFESMDIASMMFSSKLRTGLKEMQLTMHYENVQEYEGNFEQYLPANKIDEMMQYNLNDVESTEKLLEILINSGEVDLRMFIQHEWGINALSMDSVKFGEEILAKTYCQKTGIDFSTLKEMRSPMDYIPLKDVILPFISYKHPTLQALLEDMKKQIVSSKEQKGYERKFLLNGVCYSVAVGGVHTINKPEIFKPAEDEYIGHSDVTSMYPSFIIQYNWIPRHLKQEFYDEYKWFYVERINTKGKDSEKVKDKTFKLTLNSATGKMQQETSWMYDPFTVFKIRINGQLILLMLVDKLLELNCKIIQVNTDGVMYIAKLNKKDAVLDAISKIEKLTKLKFENDDYEAFYQYAVNDWFGIKEGFSKTKDEQLIEKRGMFITEARLGKGLSPSIIPKAVINYFLTKQPVEEYIKSSNDIRDFLMGQKVNKKFKVSYNNEFIQRINRYYASTNGYYLYKVETKAEDGKYINMLSKSGVTILNKLSDTETKGKNINYQFYINEAKKIINELAYKQLSLFE